MKKIFISAIAALAIITSCTKEVLPEEPVGQTFSFSLPDTYVKTALGDKVEGGYKMIWQTGDKIKVNGKESEPLDAKYNGSSSAEFTVGGVKAPFNVIYPSSAQDGDIVILNATQEFKNGNFDPAASIMLGSGTSSTKTTLKYACAYVKVTITRGQSETLTSIKLFSGDASALSGQFSANYSTGALTALSDTRNYVTATGNLAYDSDGRATAVLAVPAGTYSKGFRISVASSDGKEMGKAAYSGTGVTLSAGELLAMPAVQFQANTVQFSGGAGSVENPFKIATSEDLVSLEEKSRTSSEFASCNFRLIADIDMAGMTISSLFDDSTAPFKGSFDGNGFHIDKLCSGNPLFGYAEGATIKNLSITDASVTSSVNYAGILVKKAVKCTVSNISVSGTIKGAGYVGGIAGYFEDSNVRQCKSYADVTASGNTVGGIAGCVSANTGNALVDQCAAYGKIKGTYNMGGITGYSLIPTAAADGVDLAITNCVYAGEEMVSTQKTDYLKTGGIVGWQRSQKEGCTEHILNNVAIFTRFEFPSDYPNTSTKMYVGGIVGQMNNKHTGSAIEGCWSTFQLCNIWRGDYNLTKEVNNNVSETYYYGGIAGYSVTGLVFKNCYHYDSTKMGPSGLTAVTDCGITGPLSELLAKLNSYVSTYSGSYTLLSWSIDGRGYPVPGGLTTQQPNNKKLRISIIGDSISTFRSWLTIGNAVYYYDNQKSSTGTVSDVTFDKTYWYSLSTMLKNARIEKNISWSGSCVSSYDDQIEKPSFVNRMESKGIGYPDVVIIHGGTNDSGRSGMMNTAGYSVGSRNQPLSPELTVPESVLDALYAKNIDDLDNQYFIDAYIRLIKMILKAHPDIKIVIVGGDRITAPMADALHKIAGHYSSNVRMVDFLEDGYDNLPKFYGSHPTAAGHQQMAQKIYNEVGSWLDGSSVAVDFSGNGIKNITSEDYIFAN